MWHSLSRLFRVSAEPAPRAGPDQSSPVVDFRSLAENSTDLVIQLGERGLLRYVSPSAAAVVGWTAEEMLAGQINIVHPEDLPLIQAATLEITANDVTLKTTFRGVRKDGTVVWLEGNARRMADPGSGRKGDLILALRDISERKALEDKLQALATTDGLTGLANRRAFDEALDREWRRTLRDDSFLSLLLLDLDHFKGLNDQYGHQVGDDCLRAVAAAVGAVARRPGDLVARYGGEEIAIILSGAGAEGAFEVAEQIRSAVEALKIPHAGNKEGGYVLTASIGCATAFSRIGGTNKMPEGLLMSADSALYKAKHNGRNRVESTMLLTARVD